MNKLELSNANMLDKYLVSIDGVDLQKEEFIGLDITTSMLDNKLYCEMIVMEKVTDLTGINNNSTIDLYFKDRAGNEFINEKFKIIHVKKTLSGSQESLYVITFIDEIHYKMINSFEAISYNVPTDSYDVMYAITELHDDGDTEWNLGEETIEYPQFLSPQNVNQLRVLRKIALDNGFLFYRGLQSYSFRGLEDILTDEPLPEEMILKVEGSNTLFSIKESDFNLFDSIDLIRNAPDAKLYSMDSKDKKIVKEDDIAIAAMATALQTGETHNYTQLTELTKKKVHAGNTGLKQNRLKAQYHHTMINNTTLTVTMDGDLRMEVGKKIPISIVTRGTAQEQVNITGNYLIGGVTHHFAGKYYYLNAELIRI